MTELPKGWVVRPLSDVCEILDSRRIPINSKERNERLEGKDQSDLFPYFGATGQVGVIDGYLFEGEHVLIGEDGAPFLDPSKHKAYRVSGRFWVNNHAHILKSFFSDRFLCHYLNSIPYSEHVTGTTRLKLTKAALERITVVLPPLPEQHRIVEKIEELFSELDAGEASLTRARAQLALYRQSLLKAAFQGHLTADWRAANPDKLEAPQALLSRIRKERETRYKQALDNWQTALSEWRAGGEKGRKPGKPSLPRDFRKDFSDIEIPLHDLPDGWAWGRVGYSTCGVEYGTSAKSDEAGSVPVIRMGNLLKGRIDWGDLVYTSDLEEIDKYQLVEGDVLFNRTNSPELVGKTAVYRGERPALFAGYLVRINQIETITLADYVCYFLNSTTARQHGDTVKTDGVNQSNINGNKLQEYPFPYCTPEEQQQIVQILDQKLSALYATETEITTALARIGALRQSILKQAFSGQLVPQDPSDEPASVLLSRLRAAAPAPKTRRKTPA